MFKKLFGRNTPPAAAPQPRPHSTGPIWGTSRTPYANYFNVHLYRIEPDIAEAALRRTYLISADKGQAAIVLAWHDDWATAYVEPRLARRVGFNRLASELAHDLDTWVIGYRIYAGEGMDVHYFRGPDHLDQLALADETVQFEPATAGVFAALADVGSLVPRADDEHPLDFHFALLAALGIGDAALTWEQAVARHESGDLGASRLLAA